MKILLWAPYGAGTHFWGPGTSAYRLYRSNRNQSFEVTLIHGSDEQALFPEVFHEQIKLPTLKGSGILDKLFFFWAAKRWIKRNYHKYDVVHGISAFEYTFRPLLLFSKLGIPTYIKITGEQGGFGNNGALSKFLGLGRMRIRNAKYITGFISVSDAIRKNLISHGICPLRIYNIPNGVNTEVFSPILAKDKKRLRHEQGCNDVFTFLYVGGLTENKRVIEMVEACSILKGLTDNAFQFLIVGPDRSNGVILAQINELVIERKLSDQVFLKGYSSCPDIFYKIADVFILISKKEGLSNSLLEAMSSENVPIVTRISGSEDLVKDGANGLFSTGSPSDLAEKLFYLMENEDLRSNMAKCARDTVNELYSDTVVFSKHISLFKNEKNR